MISAEVIKDSVNPWGKRLTTFVLTYPRMIHSEFNTHRMFSRNASSSRAIPVQKQLDAVIAHPVFPLCYPSNKAGMQGGEELSPETVEKIKDIWYDMALYIASGVKQLSDLGLHKQYASRPLEPWNHITVVCTATEFDNFFALRRHPDAQPEIHELADKMWQARKESVPISRKVGEWHLPFVTAEDEAFGSYLERERALHKSVAACARVSYKNHDKTDPTDEQNKELYDRLLNRLPKHSSPAEHQAVVADSKGVVSGNFLGGWIQYRKTLSNECVNKYDGD